MAIHQLIYRSTATRLLGDTELKRLVLQARIYNYSQNITGVLLYADQQILQVLEGEAAAVEQLHEQISEDERHTQLRVLLQEAVPQRIFPAWSLGFQQASPEVLHRLAAYLDPQTRTALLPRSCPMPDVVANLLHEFIAGRLAGLGEPHHAVGSLPGGKARR
ncbi:BLUF domain-containing protein [Hymenobacter rubidus]|uniref:BLUF domain-containing protein n=1 Tax=Hymenobacter rubidus TaxID=1441626 RepID=UPI00191FF513|nr:BLUF domain-containing protein [Hymenobacter rubidus]